MNVKNSSPIDKFIQQTGPALEAFEQVISNINEPQGAMASQLAMNNMVINKQALSIQYWATDIAVKKRHNFLKKVMAETR